MRYIVEVDYKPFEFKEGVTAIGFAELVLNHAVEDVKIEIRLEGDDE